MEEKERRSNVEPDESFVVDCWSEWLASRHGVDRHIFNPELEMNLLKFDEVEIAWNRDYLLHWSCGNNA